MIGSVLLLKTLSTQQNNYIITEEYKNKLNLISEEKLKKIIKFKEKCLDSNNNLPTVRNDFNDNLSNSLSNENNQNNSMSNINKQYQIDNNLISSNSERKLLSKNSSLNLIKQTYILKKARNPGGSNSLNVSIYFNANN